jgi:phage replication-related protein YjqB (UPF0714/DUF867 family)
MPDWYRNFAELARHEVAGRDYSVVYIDRGSRVLVMAPHGGKIEPFTTEIARSVAGKELSFYSFIGMKPRDNRALHITSSAFDEGTALAAAGKAEVVLAVHGQADASEGFITVGGLHGELIARLGDSLVASGFDVRQPDAEMRGIQPENICNRGRAGKGVQFEISRRERENLYTNRALLAKFIEAVRGPLSGI